MAIYLCSFKEFTAKQGPTRLPVRTSIGYPRHPPAYRDEMVNLKELHPNKEWLWPKGLPYDQFVEAYRTKLDQIGVDTIQARFRELQRNSGREDLVLLCYEVLATPAVWCHRTIFGNWWIERTGEEVIELGVEYEPPTGGTAADPSLFDDLKDGA
jgi:hypothetical protein